MAKDATMSPKAFLAKAVNRGGLAHSWKFSVSITAPDTLNTEFQETDINFLCNKVDLPARTIRTTEDTVYGIEVLKPYGVSYENATLTFYNTNDFAARKFWEDWINLIQPPQNRNMTYYDNMTGTVKIYHYPDHVELLPEEASYYITLNEAWPVSLGELEYDTAGGEISEFTVGIQYKDWNRDGNSNELTSARTSSRNSNGSRQGRERDF